LPYEVTEIGRDYRRRECQALQQPVAPACRCDEQPEKDLPRDDLHPCLRRYRPIILAAKAGKIHERDASIQLPGGRITNSPAVYVAWIVELIERYISPHYQGPTSVSKDETVKLLLADLDVIDKWFGCELFGREPV